MKSLFAFALAAMIASIGISVAQADGVAGVQDTAIMSPAYPARLSAYGFFDGSGKPTAALLPYTLKSALFSDYARKENTAAAKAVSPTSPTLRAHSSSIVSTSCVRVISIP